MLCRGNYTRLFLECNALQGAAVTVCFPISDFDNDEGSAVSHHQIEFALFTPEIPTYRLQTLGKQIGVGLFFGGSAPD